MHVSVIQRDAYNNGRANLIQRGLHLALLYLYFPFYTFSTLPIRSLDPPSDMADCQTTDLYLNKISYLPNYLRTRECALSVTHYSV